MPKGAKFLYPRKVHVIVGEPIEPSVDDESGRVPRSAIQPGQRRSCTAACRSCSTPPRVGSSIGDQLDPVRVRDLRGSAVGRE